MSHLICRQAGPADIPLLTELVAEFHKRSPLVDFPFSPSGTRTYLEFMMRCPTGCVITHGQGLIVGTVTNYPFCDLRLAKEQLWYARSGGMLLLSAWQDWTASKGAQIDMMSAIHGPDVDADSVDKSLVKRGYWLTENTYCRKL